MRDKPEANATENLATTPSTAKDSKKKTKTRVNMFVDSDVLEVLREESAKEGIGYQTLINRTLRDAFLEKKRRLKFDEAIADIESLVREKVAVVNNQYHEVYKKIEDLEKGALGAAKKKWDEVQDRIRTLEGKVKSNIKRNKSSGEPPQPSP